MHRLRALMRKEFTHMRRDPRTLMSIFMMPLLQLVLLGYAANNDVRNVSTAVFDQDQSQASRVLLDAYRATGYFGIDHVVQSESDIVKLIDSGNVKVGIIIPPNYAKDIEAGRSVQVAVLIDGSDPTLAGSSMSAATFVGQAQATNLRFEQVTGRVVTAAQVPPVQVSTRVLYNPDLLSTYNMIPALIGMILTMSTMNLTAFAIVREREQGTIEQLIVTPIRNWELMVAKITPYIMVSIVEVILVLAVGSFWFGIPIRGSIPLLFALAFLFIVPNLGIGLLISTVAKNQMQSQMMAMPIMLPSMFLSGFFFPIAAMPIVLQGISRLIPLTYFLIIVRSLVVKGVGLQYLIPEVFALSIFSIILIVLATRRFHKTLD
ncbi:MAG TPA: ABC transporter permease [Aggregatilineales bacterium]|nr:ABC transporter permease [Aggregatilineales bacterium]